MRQKHMECGENPRESVTVKRRSKFDQAISQIHGNNLPLRPELGGLHGIVNASAQILGLCFFFALSRSIEKRACVAAHRENKGGKDEKAFQDGKNDVLAACCLDAAVHGSCCCMGR